jgi:hypothetical protein
LGEETTITVIGGQLNASRQSVNPTLQGSAPGPMMQFQKGGSRY